MNNNHRMALAAFAFLCSLGMFAQSSNKAAQPVEIHQKAFGEEYIKYNPQNEMFA